MIKDEESQYFSACDSEALSQKIAFERAPFESLFQRCACCEGFGHAEDFCETKKCLLSHCLHPDDYQNIWLAWKALVRAEHK